MARWLGALLPLAVFSAPQSGHAEPAVCDKDHWKSSVVGVAPDGRFVSRLANELELANCTTEHVLWHDANAKVRTRYVRDCDSGNWRTYGSKAPVRANPGESQASLLGRLTSALKLTPLVPSQVKVVATAHPEPHVCLRFSAVDGTETLPLWQIAESNTGCFAQVSVFEHAASKLLFMQLLQPHGHPASCGATHDSVNWVPRAQLDAARRLLRGQHALATAQLDIARTELEAAVTLSPNLVAARLGLAEVLARSGTAWPVARKALTTRFVGPDLSCRLGAFRTEGSRACQAASAHQ